MIKHPSLYWTTISYVKATQLVSCIKEGKLTLAKVILIEPCIKTNLFVLSLLDKLTNLDTPATLFYLHVIPLINALIFFTKFLYLGN